jgi:hypothetical protein
MAAFHREGSSLRLNGTLVLAVNPVSSTRTRQREAPTGGYDQTQGHSLPAADPLPYIPISACSEDALFVHPDTRRPLNRDNISARVCALIRGADPDDVPQLHDLRRAAVSLAWTRGLATEDIAQSAFWSSSSVSLSVT